MITKFRIPEVHQTSSIVGFVFSDKKSQIASKFRYYSQTLEKSFNIKFKPTENIEILLTGTQQQNNFVNIL